MILYFDEEKMPDEWTQDTMNKACAYALEEESLDPSENYSICVSFVDMDEIHRLNLEFRNVDRPTDVLSFPGYSPEELDESLDNGGEIALGDVVICEQKAHEQADEFGHPYERELIYLFVHSIFHLLGYDHEQDDEKEEMRAKEEKVMQRLGITR